MGQVTENPRYSCTLAGAVATARHIHRTIPILHAGPGCGMQINMGYNGAAGYQGVGYVGGNGLPSTNMYENEVIFGGEERLRELLEGTLEIMDGDLYYVLTGCTAGIIGDDVASIVGEFVKKGASIVHAETSGFKGSSYAGYEIAFEGLVSQLAKAAPKEEKTVNIFGIVPYQDVYWQGNLEEIDRLLKKLGLTVNSFLIHKQGPEAIVKSSGAALNIFISPWIGEGIQQIYQEEYGTPFLRYPGLPVGPTATRQFLEQVGVFLEVDGKAVQSVIAEEEAYVYDQFEKLVEVFNRYHFAIIGDSNTVIGLTRFLVNDFGQLPALAVITDNPGEQYQQPILRELTDLEYASPPYVLFSQDQWEIGEAIKKYSPTYILGSTLDKEIAIKYGIYHQSVSFPVTDRLVLNRAYAGYRGCITLVEDVFAP